MKAEDGFYGAGRRDRAAGKTAQHRPCLHRVLQRRGAKITDAKFLAQGTLYPDVIESGAAADGPAATIKLHHNVGGLPAELGFELVEPLRDLFKDEVRRLGLQLGLPEEIVWRHPFPGPGLAVRCLGEVTQERLDMLREADAIVIEEIKAAGLYRQTSQAFAVLLPVQSVGVMGDARTYENAVAVRCVNTDDFMTADWTHLPYELLARISHADHQRSERRQPRGLRHQLANRRRRSSGNSGRHKDSVPGELSTNQVDKRESQSAYSRRSIQTPPVRITHRALMQVAPCGAAGSDFNG